MSPPVAVKNHPRFPPFPPELVEACEAALDAGVFYDTDFCAFVKERLGGYGCEPVLFETVDVPSGCTVERETKLPVWDNLKAAPRGHYVIFRRTLWDGRVSYEPCMSAGDGFLGQHTDHYEEPPDPMHVLERLWGYEVYTCRHAVEAARRTAKNLLAIERCGFREGWDRVGRLRIGTKTVNRVAIEKVHEDGSLQVYGTVRAGATAYRWPALGAHAFARLLQESAQAKGARQ